MNEIDAAPLNWSDLGVSELVPTGTVTLLLADVEGSTRLWETQPDEMTAAFANLDRTLAQVVDIHHGVRPIEQGEGDSFVVAFGRASDAVACALELQRAPLDPIRLRIGLHTGEVQLRDESNYIGTTINRTARLRDLAHGGQTVLSNTTSDLVDERLPGDAWLTDLGTHSMRDLPRPEHVMQLCHPEIRNEFPPLRMSKAACSHNLPAQLTSFGGVDQKWMRYGPRMLRATGRYADAWPPAFFQRPCEYEQRLDVVRTAASDAGRDPMSITPAVMLFVITGRTGEDVAEALDSDIAKSFALNISAEVWARHGVQHPLGENFSGAQDLIPQTLDEHTVLSYTAQVPQSLMKEAFLTGTPDDVIDQAAHWRDHGLRCIVVANVSTLQPSLRKGLTASIPLATILRGLKKL
jgi:class 3 adenylate cyclase